MLPPNYYVYMQFFYFVTTQIYEIFFAVGPAGALTWGIDKDRNHYILPINNYTNLYHWHFWANEGDTFSILTPEPFEEPYFRRATYLIANGTVTPVEEVKVMSYITPLNPPQEPPAEPGGGA